MARRRGGKKIDFVHWTYASGSFLAQASGTAALTLFSALHLSETLLRIRGHAYAYVDGASAPQGLNEVVMGICAVPEGTGTTVLWSPVTDGDAPWIWVWATIIGYEEMVTDVVDVPGISSARTVVDNKAMRILRNQELQLVIESSTIATPAQAINAGFGGRFLAGT